MRTQNFQLFRFSSDFKFLFFTCDSRFIDSFDRELSSNRTIVAIYKNERQRRTHSTADGHSWRDRDRNDAGLVHQVRIEPDKRMNNHLIFEIFDCVE